MQEVKKDISDIVIDLKKGEFVLGQLLNNYSLFENSKWLYDYVKIITYTDIAHDYISNCLRNLEKFGKD